MNYLPRKPVKLSSEMCRICLRSSSTSSVNALVVAEKYREITDFVIQPTDVPQRLCLECHNLIQEFYEFVQNCKKTEDTLRALQEEIKSEPEPEQTEPHYVEDLELKKEMVSYMAWSLECEDDKKVLEGWRMPLKQAHFETLPRTSSQITEPELYRCDFCPDKVFGCKGGIKRHLRNLHFLTNFRPHMPKNHQYGEVIKRSHKSTYKKQSKKGTSTVVEAHGLYMTKEVIAPELNECKYRARFNKLPEKSKLAYLGAYNRFKKWLASNNFEGTLNEDIVLKYFKKQAEYRKPTSLMGEYSRINLPLRLKEKVDLRSFKRLKAFLSQQSKAYESTPGMGLTRTQIDTFISDAPDDVFLLTKVVTMFSIFGALKKSELAELKVSHIKETPTCLHIAFPQVFEKVTKSKFFLISGEKYLDLYHQYKALRPASTPHNWFFIQYLPESRKCLEKRLEIHELGKVPLELANYLQLDDSERYNLNSFREGLATFNHFEALINQSHGSHGAQKASNSETHLQYNIETVNKRGEK